MAVVVFAFHIFNLLLQKIVNGIVVKLAILTGLSKVEIADLLQGSVLANLLEDIVWQLRRNLVVIK